MLSIKTVIKQLTKYSDGVREEADDADEQHNEHSDDQTGDIRVSAGGQGD